jgi:hypothetical protein
MTKLNLTKKDIQFGGWIAPEIYRRDWLTLFNKCQRFEKEVARLKQELIMENQKTVYFPNRNKED